MKKEERRHTKLKAEEMIADCKIVISGKSQRQEQYHKIGMLDEGERIEYRYSDRATASDVDSFLACSVEDSSDDEEAAHDSPFEFSESEESVGDELESILDDFEPMEEVDAEISDDCDSEAERGGGGRHGPGRTRRRGPKRRSVGESCRSQSDDSDKSDDWTEDWATVERLEFSSRSGPSRVFAGEIDAITFFSLFVTEAIWQLFVVNTNRNAAAKQTGPTSRPWSPVNIEQPGFYWY
ncbi:uncharacterized protein [Oscarella lobularis]|uniref:uncharacterized protein n=1 Tax=Oscarella lobularis TaxID=121494 RepID=UPI00331419F6